LPGGILGNCGERKPTERPDYVAVLENTNPTTLLTIHLSVPPETKSFSASGNAVKHFLWKNRVILPGTGFTTKPGVAALRRTPGKKMEISRNLNGVPQRPMLAHKLSFVLWNPVVVECACRDVWLCRTPQISLE